MRKTDKYKRRRITAGIILAFAVVLTLVLFGAIKSADGKVDSQSKVTSNKGQTVEEKRKIEPKKVRQIRKG